MGACNLITDVVVLHVSFFRGLDIIATRLADCNFGSTAEKVHSPQISIGAQNL
jgi:hypothetical protein